MNFTDASETLDELAPVNFLTSRFYAAVDIKLDYKPHVILLTDVMRYNADPRPQKMGTFSQYAYPHTLGRGHTISPIQATTCNA